MVIAFICIFSHSMEVSITFATCLQHIIWENAQYTAGHDGTPCTFFSLFRKRFLLEEDGMKNWGNFEISRGGTDAAEKFPTGSGWERFRAESW